MSEAQTSRENKGEEYIQEQHAAADKFTLRAVVVVAFVGNVIAYGVLRNTAASIILGALCFFAIIVRELYLIWAFRGSFAYIAEIEPKPSWRNIAMRALIVAMLWLLPNMTDGEITLRAVLYAIAVGGGAAVTFWWYEVHAVIKKPSA